MGAIQEAFDGDTSLEVHLYSMFVTSSLDTFTESLVVGHHYIWLLTSKILKPLVGQSPYHVQNNQEFLHQLKDQNLGPDDIIMSYDVKALFTSVPIQPAIDTIVKLL